jgi:hypothetical protein
MNALDSREASSPSEESARSGQRFSCMRTMKGLSCFLSLAWLVMLHVGIAEGVPVGGINNVGIAIVTIVSIFPILLFLRGVWMYVLGFPFLFVTVLTLWGLWTTLWKVPPNLRMPPYV